LIESFEEKTTETRKVELINYVKNNIKKCKDGNLPLAVDMVKLIEDYRI
jgi:hypothetical protein